MIEAAGPGRVYLPPGSPDYNRLETAFAEHEALMRRAAEYAVDGLRGAIGRFVDA